MEKFNHCSINNKKEVATYISKRFSLGRKLKYKILEELEEMGLISDINKYSIKINTIN